MSWILNLFRIMAVAFMLSLPYFTNFLEASIPFLMRLKLEYLVTKKSTSTLFFLRYTLKYHINFNFSLPPDFFKKKKKVRKLVPASLFLNTTFAYIHLSSSSTSGIYQCPKSWPKASASFYLQKDVLFLQTAFVYQRTVYTFSFEWRLSWIDKQLTSKMW